MALVEGRAVELGPEAGARRRHHDQAPAVGHNAPDLAQHRAELFGAFDGMDQQHAIDRAVGQRQIQLVDQGREIAPFARPAGDTLGGGHEGQDARCLLDEGP